MSLSAIFRTLSRYITSFETRLLAALNVQPHNAPDWNLALNWDLAPPRSVSSHPQLGRDLLDDGMLWAVPTNRRSVERRLTRKMAIQRRMKPKRNLIVCSVCGHYHECHTICGNCYVKVRQETEAIQAAMEDSWKIDPVEQDVVVLYDGEEKNDSEFWKGKRIIEMKKERPQWFQHNLRVKTNNPDATNQTNVQPSPSIQSIVSQVK